MMHKWKNPAIAAYIFAAFVFAFGCATNDGSNRPSSNMIQNDPITPLPTVTVNELASGAKVFETNCMVCHRVDGTGGKVTVEDKTLDVEDLTSNKIKSFTDEKIIGYVMNGVPDEGMPAFKDKLSEGEMRDVVLYIRKEFHGK